MLSFSIWYSSLDAHNKTACSPSSIIIFDDFDSKWPVWEFLADMPFLYAFLEVFCLFNLHETFRQLLKSHLKLLISSPIQ